MFPIAINSFREFIRNKILSLITFFALLLIGFSLFLASISMGESTRLVVDFGLQMIELFGVLTVAFLGSQMLFRELEGRTIYLILSKPIERHEFLIGKFLGLAMVMLLLVGIESGALLIIMAIKGMTISPLILLSLLTISIKLLILIGVIIFFSTFTAPLIALSSSIGVYLIGHTGSDLITMGMRTGNHFIVAMGRFIEVVFPNMEALSLPKYALNSSVNLSSSTLFIAAGIALAYITLLLISASWIFNRKNFERF